MSRVYKSKLFREAMETKTGVNIEDIKTLLGNIQAIQDIQKIQDIQAIQDEEYDPIDNWSIVSRRLKHKIDEFIVKTTDEEVLDLSVNYVYTKMKLSKEYRKRPVVNYIKYKIRQTL